MPPYLCPLKFVHRRYSASNKGLGIFGFFGIWFFRYLTFCMQFGTVFYETPGCPMQVVLVLIKNSSSAGTLYAKKQVGGKPQKTPAFFTDLRVFYGHLRIRG